MKTIAFSEIHARLAEQRAEVRPTLTPKGAAVLAVHRLRYQLAQLSREDLEDVGPMVAGLLVDAARAANA